MRKYSCLPSFTQLSSEDFSIVPIRDEDKYLIMKWRNEQIYHLRQNQPLKKEEQELYFNNIVDALFQQDNPNQILVSYLKNDVCIGYGGLVHINWLDKNAEISFIIDTALEKTEFDFHWRKYLSLIENLAFLHLNLHKIYTFAFDIRPHLYRIIEQYGFVKEAHLKEHHWFHDRFIDAVIHSKRNISISFRRATESDMLLYYSWANDRDVRLNSFNSEEIQLEAHISWFKKRVNNPDYLFYLFEDEFKNPVGQVRIEKIDQKVALIGLSIDSQFRGKGFASRMIEASSNSFLQEFVDYTIHAYVKESNLASQKAFVKSGYCFLEKTKVNEQSAFVYYYPVLT